MDQRINIWLAFFLLFSGCSVKAHHPSSQIPDSVNQLRMDLDSIFSNKDFAGAQWSIAVASTNDSTRLYERNAGLLCIPGSNNKIITAAVALLRLGPDYRFKTQILAEGKIDGTVLEGNLIIIGGGDPSISPAFQKENPFAVFQSWAERLKEQNIQAIAGDIIGDSGAFEEIPYGKGWEWDDLIRAYAAPVSALQFNENLITLQIAPGVNAGETAFVKPFPLDGYFALFNRISTGEENSATDIQIERIGSSESIQLRGNIPLKSAEFSRNVSVRFPTLYYLSALKKSWGDAGIDLSKTEIREAKNHKAEGASLLWTHQSPALSEIMKSLLKESSNLGAETLARTLGMELRGEGAFSKGKEVVEEELSKMGLDKSSYQFADASGLSRHNMVSVDTLLQVLRYMKKDGRFSYFYDALPIAGCDGTLANRMRGTAAAGNAHAKTGSLSNISAISGYVQTRDGEMLAFSIIANNFLAPRSKIESAQDSAIERLAKFSRK